jgi:hypothetical protein
MRLTVTGVKPWDGSYELRFADELTTREYGWIKRLSGYLPLELDKAVTGGDPEFMCVLAAIAMRRAGKIDADQVPDVFERLADAPFGSTITFDTDDEPEAEGDAGPPARSSTGNGSSSGDGSTTSSETSPASPPDSGTPASDSSASVPLKSVS